jgi:hypothetical protein
MTKTFGDDFWINAFRKEKGGHRVAKVIETDSSKSGLSNDFLEMPSIEISVQRRRPDLPWEY